MADSSRTFRKMTACVLVLCCLGGTVWFLLPEGKIPVVDEARNAVRNLTGQDSKSDVSNPTLSTDDAKAKSDDAQVAGGSRQVAAPLNDGPRPVPLDPQAELLSRVEKAMQQTISASSDGDSVSGSVENRPPEPDASRKDSVVTPRFVSDMAAWLASAYVPSHHEGRSGRTSVSLVQANFRYSNSGTLRSAERDPLKSRSSILNYVFTPGMLEALYRMYAPSFMEEMERCARETRRNPLSEAQVADMFDVYADKFQRLAVSLDAAASVDLPALSAAIHREAGHEAAANDNFARAYMALSLARESGNRDEVAIQSRRMAENTRVAGMHAERQERARNDMAYAIRRKAEGKALSSSELLFLGEWLSRRHCSVEAVRAAADVCRRMAEQMHDRAEEILHRRSDEAAVPSVEGKASGTETVSSKGSESVGDTTEALKKSETQGASSVPEQKRDTVHADADKTPPAGQNGGKSAPSSVSGTDSGGSASPAAPSTVKPAFPEFSGTLNFSSSAKAESQSGEESSAHEVAGDGSGTSRRAEVEPSAESVPAHKASDGVPLAESGALTPADVSGKAQTVPAAVGAPSDKQPVVSGTAASAAVEASSASSDTASASGKTEEGAASSFISEPGMQAGNSPHVEEKDTQSGSVSTVAPISSASSSEAVPVPQAVNRLESAAEPQDVPSVSAPQAGYPEGSAVQSAEPASHP